ncbi:MAG: MerR family transcriptional regulator [Acidobacteriaceae bacterium]
MAERATGAKRKAAAAAGFEEVVLPDKLYFRIGEAAEALKVETYVLRFWETEFPQLKPTKSNTGQRLYRKRDLELLVRIRQLLYRDGFTIPGARQALKEETKNKTAQPLLFSGSGGAKATRVAKLKKVKNELEQVKDLLRRKQER